MYTRLHTGFLFLTALALHWVVPQAHAQGAPDAGRLLHQLHKGPALPQGALGALPPETGARPALLLPDSTAVQVTAFRITGATAIETGELQAQVADLVGGEHTLTELELGARRITTLYRQRGYLLARAYLPAQNLHGREIEIHILEGSLGKVTLNNQARISSDWLNQRLGALDSSAPLRWATLDNTLLGLAETPGLEVRSSLKPGALADTTDLDIDVRDARQAQGRISTDNFGDRYSGQYRLSGAATLNNPLRLGDALEMDATSAGDNLNYGHISYQLPVSRSGTRLGAAYAGLHYRLGKEFRQFDGYGAARVGSLFLIQPLVRRRSWSLSAQLGFEHKQFDDVIGATASRINKQYDNLTLGLSGERRDSQDGGGLTEARVTLTRGELASDAGNASLEGLARRADSNFFKLNPQVIRQQRLGAGLQLYTQFSAQISNGNLDPAEKMELGGAYAVRAYPQGEAAADDAWLGNVELRYSLNDNWQALGYFDAARGHLNHDPVAADGANRRTLAGFGAGLRWATPQGYSLETTAAWRSSGEPSSERDRHPRVNVQFGRQF